MIGTSSRVVELIDGRMDWVPVMSFFLYDFHFLAMRCVSNTSWREGNVKSRYSFVLQNQMR